MSDFTAYDLADQIRRNFDTREVPGGANNPLIMAAFWAAGGRWITSDEVAWCSAMAVMIAKMRGLPTPCDLDYPSNRAYLANAPAYSAIGQGALQARTWLRVGVPVELENARRGYDVVVTKRGVHSPGPEVIDAPGHVFWFGQLVSDEGVPKVVGIGGNQSDAMTLGMFPADRVLGVRRLA